MTEATMRDPRVGPDDEDWSDYDDMRDGCPHDEYDVDWEGRAECICGERWWLTDEQLAAHHGAEARWQEEYYRMQRRENSRLWRAVDWLAAILSRVRRWLRREDPPLDDPNIPF